MQHTFDNRFIISLRGGGCGSSKIATEPTVKGSLQDKAAPPDLLSSMERHVKTIEEKAPKASEKNSKDEIMIAIQWFNCQAEEIQDLSDSKKAMSVFDFLKSQLLKLLQASSIYIRSNGIVCLFVLQICTQISKSIFQFFLKEKKGYMPEDELKPYKKAIEEIQQKMARESSELWRTGVEFEISMVKTVIDSFPTKKGQEIGKQFLSGLFSSLAERTISADLVESIVNGAIYLYNQNELRNKQKQFEAYFYLDWMKWQIIKQFRQGYKASTVLVQLQTAYQKHLQNNKAWTLHYIWIRILGDLISYRPIIAKHQFSNILSELKIENADELWQKMIDLKMINLLNYDRSQAILEIENKEILINKNSDEAIFNKVFEGRVQLKYLQQYLLKETNEQEGCQLLSSYLTFGLNTQQEKLNDNEEKNDQIDSILFLYFVPINKFQSLHMELQYILQEMLDLSDELYSTLQCVQKEVEQQNENKIKLYLTDIQSDYETFQNSLIKSFKLVFTITQITHYTNSHIQSIEKFCKDKSEESEQEDLKQLINSAIQIEFINLSLQEFVNHMTKIKFNQRKVTIEEIQYYKIQKDDLVSKIDQLLENKFSSQIQQYYQEIISPLKVVGDTYRLEFQIIAEEQEQGKLIQLSDQVEQIKKKFTIFTQQTIVKQFSEENSDLNKVEQMRIQILKHFGTHYEEFVEQIPIILESYSQISESLTYPIHMFDQENEDPIQIIKNVIQNKFQWKTQLTHFVLITKSLFNLLSANFTQNYSFFEHAVNDNGLQRILWKQLNSQDQHMSRMMKFGFNQAHQALLQYFNNSLTQKFEQYQNSDADDLAIMTQCLNLQDTLIIKQFDIIQKMMEKCQIYLETQKKKRKIITQEQQSHLTKIQEFKKNMCQILKSFQRQESSESNLQQIESEDKTQRPNSENSQISQLHLLEKEGIQQANSSDGPILEQIDATSNMQADSNLEMSKEKEVDHQIEAYKLVQKTEKKNELLIVSGYLEGMLSTQKQFHTTVQKYKILDIDKQIKDFDAQYIPLLKNFHQIIQSLKADDVQYSSYVRLLGRQLYNELNQIEITSLKQYKLNDYIENNSELLEIGFKTVNQIQKEIQEIGSCLTGLQEEIRVARLFAQAYKKESYNQEIVQSLQKSFKGITKKKEFAQRKFLQTISDFFMYFEDTLYDQQNQLSQKINKHTDQKEDYIKSQLLLWKSSEIIQQYKELFEILTEEIEITQQLPVIQQQQDTQGNEGDNLIDVFSNKEWKVRESFVFVLISIQANKQQEHTKKYCQETLIKLWKIERDQRVKHLLKNKEILLMQTTLISGDWKSLHDKLKQDMQEQFQKIKELQNKILQQGDTDQRKIFQNELEKQYQLMNEQLDNIQDMASQMSLVVEFVKEIKKDLARIEAKLNQIKDQLNDIGNDIKYLKGKTYDQLLNLRMKQILQEKEQKALETIYIDLQIEQIDINSNDKEDRPKEKINIQNYKKLFSSDRQDKDSELNDFLKNEYEIMLIHGQAGSGKSTAAKKIEEILWEFYQTGIKLDKDQSSEECYIPIFVSLPSLQEPRYNAIEEVLASNAYKFNKLQIDELKEAVNKKQIQLIFIFDSYDELKLEFLKQNLYHTNQLEKTWSYPKIIYTTRSEVLTENYRNWFKTDELTSNKFKEIRIMNFQQEKQKEYLNKYCYLSVKLILLEIHKFLLNILTSKVEDNQQFQNIWKRMEKSLNFDDKNAGYLLNEFQIQHILNFCQKDQVLSQMSEEQLRNTKVLLEGLWSVQMYQQTIDNINLANILQTPFLMEIVVKVLPIMVKKYSDKKYLKNVFLTNFAKLLEQQHQLQKLEQVQDYNMQSLSTWEELNREHFIDNYSIANQIIMKDDYIIMNKKEYKFKDADLIVQALKQQSLSRYDFYEEFVQFYHDTQVEKWRDLGRQYNPDIITIDLMKFSINLALQMTKNEKTQVNYKNMGMLKFSNETQESKWEDYFFNDQDYNGEYKKLIRSGILINQKGNIFSFTHKSIQEFLVSKDIFNQFLSQDLNFKLLEFIINRYREKNLIYDDIMKELKKQQEDIINESLDRQNIMANYERIQQRQKYQLDFHQILEFLPNLYKSSFNTVNLSSENYLGASTFLIEKFKNQSSMIKLLQNLVKITSISEHFIRAGSNSIYLLVQMNEFLGREDFSRIMLRDTSINGASLPFSDLSGSYLTNIKISGINLNGSKLKGACWSDLKINELPSFQGHTKGVRAVAFSPDGNIIASGSEDSTIKLWDVKNGNDVYAFKGHSSIVLALSFSSEGFLLASGSEDNSIKIWDVRNRAEQSIQTLKCLSAILSVAFTADGRAVAYGSWDGQFKIQSIWGGKEVVISFSGHIGAVYSVALSPDGSTIASAGLDHTVRLWSVKNGRELIPPIDHEAPAYTVTFSPDGKIVASGSEDNTIKLWYVNKDQEKIKSSVLQGHKNSVYSLSFSPDGNTLVSGSSDNTIRLWDVKSEKEVSTLQGHSLPVKAVAFSPNGSTVASGSLDNSIGLWDVKRGKETSTLQGHANLVKSVSFSGDGKNLVSNSEDNTIRLWDVGSGKEISVLQGHYYRATQVSFTKDKNVVALGCDDFVVRIWNVKSGEVRKLVSTQCDKIQAFCFIQDQIYAAGSQINSIQVWNLTDKSQIYSLNQSSENIISYCFSPDGKCLGMGCRDSKVLIWKIKDELEATELLGHESAVNTLAFSPDSSIIASAGNTIKIWDLVDKKQICVMQGHLQRITTLSFSYDGTTIVSGSDDYTVRLWDVNNGVELCVLYGHSDVISTVQFSPNGTKLATGSVDSTIRLWELRCEKNLLQSSVSGILSTSYCSDAKTIACGTMDNNIKIWSTHSGEEVAQLEGHLSSVMCVAYSKHGLTLVSGSMDSCVKLWNMSTKTEIKTLKGHSRGVYSVCFSPDGKNVASGSGDNTIIIWDVSKGEIIYTLTEHKKSILSLEYSVNGSYLASSGQDTSIILWSKDGQIQHKFMGHTSAVNAVSFSPNSLMLASGGMDNTIRLWDIQKKEQTAIFQGRSSPIYTIAFSPDGQTIASGSLDHTIRLWDVKTGKASSIQGHSNAIYSVCFSPDGKNLVSGSKDNTIKLWTLKHEKKMSTLTGHENAVLSIAFSKDGKSLVSGSEDNTVKLWNMTNGEVTTPLRRNTPVFSVCFSIEGNLIASEGDGNSIQLWDIEKQQEYTTFRGHQRKVLSLCFSQDRSNPMLASGSEDTTVRLWDVDEKKPKFTLQGHSNSVFSVVFSPIGSIIASGSMDNTIRLWDVNTGKVVRTLIGHSTGVLSVSFSSDGSLVASGSWDTQVKVWDVKEGKECATLKGHENAVQAVAFSPNENILASGSIDKTIRLWDISTMRSISKLEAHQNPVRAICFSPEGNTIASGSEDNTILLWDVLSGKEIYPFQGQFYKEFNPKIAQIYQNYDLEEKFQTELDFKVRTVQYIYRKAPICYKIISRRLQQFTATDGLLENGRFETYTGFDLRKLLLQRGAKDLEKIVDGRLDA